MGAIDVLAANDLASFASLVYDFISTLLYTICICIVISCYFSILLETICGGWYTFLVSQQRSI